MQQAAGDTAGADAGAAGGSAPSQTPGPQGRRLVLRREQSGTRRASPEPKHLLRAMAGFICVVRGPRS